MTTVEEATILPFGQGERIEVSQSTIVLKSTAASSSGSLFLVESTLEAGFPGPPLHTHERLHDMFYVLEGTLSIAFTDRTIEAGPGTFVSVPPGVVHTFRNASDRAVRVLNFSTPAGFEGYMRDLGEAYADGRKPTSEEIGEIASRYDFTIAP